MCVYVCIYQLYDKMYICGNRSQGRVPIDSVGCAHPAPTLPNIMSTVALDMPRAWRSVWGRLAPQGSYSVASLSPLVSTGILRFDSVQNSLRTLV